MKLLHVLLPAVFTTLSNSASIEKKSLTFSTYRKPGAAHDGKINTAIDSQLYWYGNFTVGKGTNLELLLDTGSSDLYINKGLYQPSKYMTPYDGNDTFSQTYEGVDRQGFGFETINGTATNDLVSAGGLTVTNQTIGVLTSLELFDVPSGTPNKPGDGIIGLLFEGGSHFEPPALPWFYNLCSQQLISACRFGLAFGTSGVGQLIIGEYAKSLTAGPVVSVPNVGGATAYAALGDITLNGTVVSTDQIIVIDSGTNNIQAPIEQAQKLFNLLDYPTQLLTQAPTPFDPGLTITTLSGFFNCRDPPSLGFSFPAASQLAQGEKATVFEVSKDVWGVFNNSATNCTSILGGTNSINAPDGTPLWLLGQAFFSGHYVDFSTNGSLTSGNDTMISFAKLKHPKDGSA